MEPKHVTYQGRPEWLLTLRHKIMTDADRVYEECLALCEYAGSLERAEYPALRELRDTISRLQTKNTWLEVVVSHCVKCREKSDVGAKLSKLEQNVSK